MGYPARANPETEQIFRSVQAGNYEIYEGLAAIARVMGKSESTVWRYIHHNNLRAAKLPGGTWCISNSLIDAWLVARHKAIMEQKRGRAGAG